MLGILVLLVISWLVLYFFERKSIVVLIDQPLVHSFKLFLLGLLFSGTLCSLVQFADSFLQETTFTLNENFQLSLFLSGISFDFRSVVTEELVFRGAVLYILLKRIKPAYAVLLSGIAFGVYHWFSFGVFGQLIPMVFIFIGTGLTGLAWAIAFKKSGTLVLPIALHLGWNLVFNSVFSKGPLGDLLLVTSGGDALGNSNNIFSFLLQILLLPIFTFVFVKFLVKKKANLAWNQQIK